MSCLVVPPVNGTVADVEASDKALWDKVWIGVGIFLGLLGSVLINLGNNMQALAMQRAGTLKARARWAAVHERATARRSKTEAVAAMAGPVYSDEALAALARWTRIKNGGTAIFIFGSVINFAAFAFAAASVLAPLEAVQFITNLVFGKCLRLRLPILHATPNTRCAHSPSSPCYIPLLGACTGWRSRAG